jgi:GNAT superfamily N-acetyltransferase
MQVRLASPNDKPQVLNLLNEFGQFVHSKNAPLTKCEVILDEVLARPDTMIFVAEDNGKLIGLATFYILPNIRHAWHQGHIEDFYVTKSLQHQGVGTAIFNAIKKYCRENNIKVLKLASGRQLAKAHKFYTKNDGQFTEKSFKFDLS